MRYFFEVSYLGTHYSGFQIQQSVKTIQGEVEAALFTYFKFPVSLTGSSRTDAGVHALKNFFHADIEVEIKHRFLYNINALLPPDIVIKAVYPVNTDVHCRFTAIAREYKYFIYTSKNPFIKETALFYPYKLDFEKMQYAAQIISNQTDFTSFSKRNTNTSTNICTISKSIWSTSDSCIEYNVRANRFLRGMVRGLVGTMLLVGRDKLSISNLENIFLAKDCTKANFACPAQGLFLVSVEFPFQLEPFL